MEESSEVNATIGKMKPVIEPVEEEEVSDEDDDEGLEDSEDDDETIARIQRAHFAAAAAMSARRRSAPRPRPMSAKRKMEAVKTFHDFTKKFKQDTGIKIRSLGKNQILEFSDFSSEESKSDSDGLSDEEFVVNPTAVEELKEDNESYIDPETGDIVESKKVIHKEKPEPEKSEPPPGESNPELMQEESNSEVVQDEPSSEVAQEEPKTLSISDIINDGDLDLSKNVEIAEVDEEELCSEKTAEELLDIKQEETSQDFDISDKLEQMGEISVKPCKKEGEEGDAEADEEDKTDGDDDKKTNTSAINVRRNIREVMDEKNLDASTLAAQRQESERLARVQEQQRIIREVQRQIAMNRQNKIHQKTLQLLQGGSSILKQQQNKLNLPNTVMVKMPSGEIKRTVVKPGQLDISKLVKPTTSGVQKVGKTELKTEKKEVVEIVDSSSGEESSSSSDSDDCIMLSDSEVPPSPEADEDPGNSGLHVNDTYNVPDEQGRVQINIGHPENEEDIFLAPQIARVIKPHQIGGVRFLFDNIIESVERFTSSTGFGCILAHSMGLGKTLQIVCFCDIFLRHTSSKTVLCIMPINTLQNWVAEFNMWLPLDPTNSPLAAHGEVRPRNFPIYVLNDSHKTLQMRAKVVKDWTTTGGVLMIGYELYRLLSMKKDKKPRKKRKDAKVEIERVEKEKEDKKLEKPDLNEDTQGSDITNLSKISDESKMDKDDDSKELDGKDEKKDDANDEDKKLLDEMFAALVKPGPDLVICDEGHRIKNSHSNISYALKQMRTKRRIVLTGYPLQNNLIEYWCMVDFVRPNYLGSKTEFCNMFERPIQNGQCIDSTPQDIRLMRYRAHVLHSLLVGFVQRRSHAVLQSTLPQKEEYVLLIRMTPLQRKLYDQFMNEVVRSTNVPNPLKAFAICCKIWNHPDVLYNFLKKRNEVNAAIEEDLDLEELRGVTKAGRGARNSKAQPRRAAKPRGAAKKPAATIPPNTSAAPGVPRQDPQYNTPYPTNGPYPPNSYRPESGQYPPYPPYQNSPGYYPPNQNYNQNYDQNYYQQQPPYGNQPNYPNQYPPNNPEWNQGYNQNNWGNNSGYYGNTGYYNNPQYPNGQQPQDYRGNPPDYNNAQQYPPGNNQQQFPPANNAQQYPPGTNPQQFPSGNNTQQFPPGNNQQQFPPANNAQQYPPTNNPPQYPPPAYNAPPTDQPYPGNAVQPYQNQEGFGPQQRPYQAPYNAPGYSEYPGQSNATPEQQYPNNQQSQDFPNQTYPPTQHYPNNTSYNSSQPGQYNQYGAQNYAGYPPSSTPAIEPAPIKTEPNIPPNYPPKEVKTEPDLQQNQPPYNNPAYNYNQPNTSGYPQDQAATNGNYPPEYPNFAQTLMTKQPLSSAGSSNSPLPTWPITETLKTEVDRFKEQEKSEVKSESDGEVKIADLDTRKIVKDDGKTIKGELEVAPVVNNAKSETQDDKDGVKKDSKESESEDEIPKKGRGRGKAKDKKAEKVKAKPKPRGRKDRKTSKDKNNDDKNSDSEESEKEEKMNREEAMAIVKKAEEMTYDWAAELLKDYIPGIIENSAKMELFFYILNESIKMGDRLLLFSQSLFTLNLIEDFLEKNYIPGTNCLWERNTNYYRLDGSTHALEREKLINEFNANPNIYLFLVSTRAGSLGINLVGANRVIVFDASWNPCHDTQAVCRVYRYGQKKPCFVYRFVMDCCLEKKIYDRQINKQGMADRVVDECNPDAVLSMKEITNLCFDNDEKEPEVKDLSEHKDKYLDVLMQGILTDHGQTLTKEPFQHESLLVDRKEKKLSSAEKRLAQRGYELEKKAALAPKPAPAYRTVRAADGSLVQRPVASVRPMQHGARWIPADVWRRQGMTAQEMTLPLDVVIPTNSAEKTNIVLKAGQRVMVLKSPKGIYMQLESGKIIAIKTSLKGLGQKGENRDNPLGKKVLNSRPASANLPGALKNNSAITITSKTGPRPGFPRVMSRPMLGQKLRPMMPGQKIAEIRNRLGEMRGYGMRPKLPMQGKLLRPNLPGSVSITRVQKDPKNAEKAKDEANKTGSESDTQVLDSDDEESNKDKNINSSPTNEVVHNTDSSSRNETQTSSIKKTENEPPQDSGPIVLTTDEKLPTEEALDVNNVQESEHPQISQRNEMRNSDFSSDAVRQAEMMHQNMDAMQTEKKINLLKNYRHQRQNARPLDSMSSLSQLEKTAIALNKDGMPDFRRNLDDITQSYSPGPEDKPGTKSKKKKSPNKAEVLESPIEKQAGGSAMSHSVSSLLGDSSPKPRLEKPLPSTASVAPIGQNMGPMTGAMGAGVPDMNSMATSHTSMGGRPQGMNQHLMNPVSSGMPDMNKPQVPSVPNVMPMNPATPGVPYPAGSVPPTAEGHYGHGQYPGYGMGYGGYSNPPYYGGYNAPYYSAPGYGAPPPAPAPSFPPAPTPPEGYLPPNPQW